MVEAHNPGDQFEADVEDHQEPNSPNGNPRRGQKILLWLGGILLVGATAGLSYGWWFLQQKLNPLIERELTDLINRPVEIGSLQSFSLSGVRFGESAIPATKSDPDRVTIKAVDVDFDLLKLLTERELELDVTLIRPDVYLEQDPQKRWLTTEIDSRSGQESAVSIDLRTIRFQNADLVLLARSEAGKLKTPVEIAIGAGQARFVDNAQQIQFDLAGGLVDGGKLRLEGTMNTTTDAIDVTVIGNDLNAPDIKNLIALPFQLQTGIVDSNLEVQLRRGQVASIDGVASFAGVTARLPALPQPFQKTEGELRFQGSQIRLEDVSGTFGSIPGVANGVVDTSNAKLEIRAKTAAVEVNRVVEALQLSKPPVPIAGKITANLQVSGTGDRTQVDVDVASVGTSQIDRVNFRSVEADLSLVDAQLQIKQFQAVPTVGGRLTGKGQVELEPGNFVFDVRAREVPGSAIARTYDTTLPIDPGLVSGSGRFFGNLNDAETLRAQGVANFPLGGGTVQIRDIELEDRLWQADVQAQGVRLDSLATNLPPELRDRRLKGVFDVAGTIDSFQPEAIRANGTASIQYAGGTVTAEDLQVLDGNWTTRLQARDLELQEFIPQAAVAGSIFSTLNLAGDVNNLTLEAVDGEGTGKLIVPGGTLEAREIELENGNFEAVAVPQDLPLKTFSPELQGNLNGKLDVAGSLDNITPTAIRADGRVNLSQGIDFIERPISAAIAWNGQRLDIESATAPGFDASGLVIVKPSFFTGTEAGLAGIEQYQLDVAVEELALNVLPIPLPEPVTRLDYAGAVDFEGVVAGTPINPEINGDLTLENFQVEALDFEESLGGTVQLSPEAGVNLQLTGNSDQIELNLSPENVPESFLVEYKTGEEVAVVRGSQQGELIQIEAANVPVESLKDFTLALNPDLPPTVTSLPIAGDLAGEFAVDLDTLEVYAGEVAIANPVVGKLEGDRATANFRYVNDQLTFRDAQWQQGETQYELDGSISQVSQNPQFQARVEVQQGQIQEILETLEIFELADLARGLNKPEYGDAADLYAEGEPTQDSTLFSVGLPEATILDQLRRLTEIETELIRDRQERESALLPELATLQGSFDGTIDVAGSMQSGVEAEFDLQGQQWQWGSYRANQIIAQGSYEDGILTLLPVRLQSGASFANFAGNFGGETQSGQLRLVNVPVSLVQQLVDLPPAIGFGGMIDATVAIAGTQANPQARGELTVKDATINQTAVESTQGSFSYNDARLNFFASSVLAESADPLTVVGSFPYQLPFASVQPDNQKLTLNLDVQDEGLALLDILTKNQVTWVAGNGEVELDIVGEFEQETNNFQNLQAEGIINLEDATIAARVIPEASLTDVNGKILFNFDRLDVENFQGKINGGEVSVAGTLPLTETARQPNPLTVTLQDLVFDLKGLYEGGVQGEVIVTGTALAPDISGEVELFDGEILLGETTDSGSGSPTTDNNNDDDLVAATDYQNLRLKLGEDIRVTRPPILNFLATGSLTVNGTFNDPRPEGTIQLRRGQINLFATQFQLAGGEENTAEFSAERGLDPYLDVNLVTSVVETDTTPTRQDISSADVRETQTSPLGGIQTVRVEAEVEGFASQLTDSIELTSSPPRSQTEIIALLGGGFVNTLGRGDTTLGLANLAGSALFGSFQGAIGEALGLSEFRVFPTPVIDDEDRTGRSTSLGVAAEASVDITSDLSFSVQKILNTSQPAQYGIRYRLDNSTVLRGSTDFAEDSRVLVEFEQRF